MPERAPAPTIRRAIQRLRDHSRQCHDVEARRRLIATERWLMWMLLREEDRGAPPA